MGALMEFKTVVASLRPLFRRGNVYKMCPNIPTGVCRPITSSLPEVVYRSMELRGGGGANEHFKCLNLKFSDIITDLRITHILY